MTTSRLVTWLEPSLASRPVSDALAAGLRGLVLDGRLMGGTRLPAERALAAALGLSRATVTRSYDQLRGEGLLVSSHGAGTVVQLPIRAFDRPDDRVRPSADLIDLTLAVLPAPSVLPEVVAEALPALPRLLAGAGLHPMGLPELREAVAHRYTVRGLPTSSDEVLIVSGALHAWNLLLRVLASPGAGVIIEQPTYPAIIDAALAHHVRIHPLPVDAAGWDLAQLARPARSPVLAHLTLDGQNPTGLWADDGARSRLLRELDPATLVVADETLVDLPLEAAPPTRPAPALAAPSTSVVAVGSMSKSFWAGLRIGWIRAPAELVRRLAAARAGQDLATATLDQLVAVRLLAVADEVLPARRALLRDRCGVLTDALATYAPEWSAARPRGGMVLWVDLVSLSSTRLAQRALGAGARITPGPRFTVTGTHDRWTRIPFVQPPDRLVEGVRRLASAATKAGTPARHPRGGADTAWSA